MKKESEKLIKEIVIKECERFRLTKTGIVEESALDNLIEAVSGKLKVVENDDFTEFRNEVLLGFYREIGFKENYKAILESKPFNRSVKYMFINELSAIWANSPKTDTDTYLAPNQDSLSYALTEPHFEDIYNKKLKPAKSITGGDKLVEYSRTILNKEFPLSDNYVMEQLKDNSNFFWGKIYTKLKSMVNSFAYNMLGYYNDDVTHDTWSETCTTLNNALRNGRLQESATSKDIISYAVGIIKNKNRELIRNKTKNRHVDIDNLNYKLTAEDDAILESPMPDHKNMKGEESQSFNILNYIDRDDEESLKNAMVFILNDPTHPVHTKMVEGLEDKVKILFEHYLDGLSYEQIVIKYQGKEAEKDMIRHAARVRQEIKRLKSKLWNRFLSIIDE